MVVFGVVANGSEAASGLRLATATTKAVAKTLDEVGIIEPVSAAAVAFPVGGTVASVAVTAGATVTRGQTLATLDPTVLQRAVNNAQATLDQAKLTLANAIAASAASDDETPQDDSSAELDAARQAVLEAQHEVDAKLDAAQEALDSASQVCAGATDAPAKDDADDSTDDNSTGDDSTDESTDAVEACRTALSGVLDAQRETAGAQQQLSAAATALDALISQAASSSSNPRNPSSSGSDASAADLVAYQKAIDAASAGVAVAKQNLAAATIVSPIDGVVQAVRLAAGDAVAASSTTAVIKVIGQAGYEVTAIVAVDKLAEVKLGQDATVKPDGSSRTLAGEVVAIGAPLTTNGATTYPVSIGVDADDALRNGTVAAVAITTATADSAVAVPTSAVHVEGDIASVNVANGSTVKRVTVTLGVIGKQWTQIKSGLRAGQRVVIADLSEPLPGSATSSSNGENRSVDFKPAFNSSDGGAGPVIIGPGPNK
jgi:HlyD family secretion protein